MKTTKTPVLLFVAAFLTSCTRAPEKPFEPVIPKRSAPVLFSYAEFPVENWKSKSATNFPWFVETPKGWYIDWDCEGTNITILVVHHSAGSGQETPESISETNYREVYDRETKPLSPYHDERYAKPFVLALPVHSGHFLNGRETFSAYHFLIYPHGEIKTMLVPHREINGKLVVDMIGWGAGNWKVNCSSVQVCLLGAYSAEKPPTKEALRALASIIRYYRTRIPALRIVSHDEVRTAGPKNCPGGWFDEWRKTLK